MKTRSATQGYSPFSEVEHTTVKVNELPATVYIYTPTERHIFDPSPYKDRLLPLWRFKTPEVARSSAEAIWHEFCQYDAADDFIGMDNARKFLQMGMTRSARYANWPGGRKYVHGKKASEDTLDHSVSSSGKQKVDPERDWKGKKEKKEASDIFREYWNRAKAHPKYVVLKEHWLAEQKKAS